MIQIDYHELSILIEACWSGGTILRASVMQKAVDNWYNLLTPTERNGLYSYANRVLKDRGAIMEMDKEIQEIFFARYNPSNQYNVHVRSGAGDEILQAFKWKDRFYVKKNTHIIPQNIMDYSQIIL